MCDEIVANNIVRYNTKRPLILVDMYAEYKIPKDKIDVRNEIISYIISHVNTTPYIYNIHKAGIRRDIEKTEIGYIVYSSAVEALTNVIYNYYTRCNKVLMCFVGKYKDYGYIYSGIVNQIRQTNITTEILTLNIKHPGIYINRIKNMNCNISPILEDVLKINKILDDIENS